VTDFFAEWQARAAYRKGMRRRKKERLRKRPFDKKKPARNSRAGVGAITRQEG